MILGHKFAPRARVATTMLILVIVVAAVAFAQTAAGTSALRSLGLAAPADQYTALSFEQPRLLATLTEYGQYGNRRQPVAFTITNEEHHQMAYRWRLEVDGSVRATGSQRVPSGASVTLHRMPLLRCVTTTRRVVHRGGKAIGNATTVQHVAKQVRVAVSITSPLRSIDFFVACHA
jgi:DMSO/TMAO reductase YedYZ molybdopterin-dependent catalytic subunit